MKIKVFAIVELLIIVALAVALFISQYVTFRTLAPVVREPGAPGESTISYTPLPHPKFPMAAVRQLVFLRQLTQPEIEKVTDDIYLARGFAMGNVGMVVTDDGLVIIDTTESPETARQILEEFRKISDKPIRYIIYTHGHIDHVQGTEVFMEPGAEVIATSDAVEFIGKDLGWLSEFHVRSRTNQAGEAAEAYSLPLPVGSPIRAIRAEGEVVYPTITFDKEYSFALGGKKFELYHTWGETPDQLMVWLPNEEALFAGDLFCAWFPNLSTPMLESRPVKAWYESLDRMVALEPAYLIPGHTAALDGEEEIHDTLVNYSRAVRYVYEETVKAVNEGKSVEEAVQSIKLPEELAKLPYLQEVYGRVDWSVRGTYLGLTGWYDGSGTNLAPAPPQYCAREIVNLAGGADKILVRAIELQDSGDHQLACELCDIVLAANPDDRLAHIVKAVSLEYLGYSYFNLNTFGFYRSASALEREAAGIKPTE